MPEEISVMRGILVLTLILTLFAGCGGDDSGMTGNAECSADVGEGSPCTYDSYRGRARITRIAKTDASRAQKEVIGGPGYEGYEVWFRFVPDESTPSDVELGSLVEREHLLTLRNGWYVGPRYMEKYGLKPEEECPAVLRVIKTGSCAPAVFELEGVEAADYFETTE
jgi:hypothetical protein